MPPGPILIFDKSLLQGLNPDEAVWLDHFFLSNITPLFFIETLADLEKSIVRGRTPEVVVGNIAIKTPDMQSHPNAHHLNLVLAELLGRQQIPMDGRIIRAPGAPVLLGDQRGIVFRESDEEAALARWHAGQFSDLERQTAKTWRRQASQSNLDDLVEGFKRWFVEFPKPRDLAETKQFAEDRINNSPNPDAAFQLGLSLLSVGAEMRESVTQRWIAAGRPPIRDYAPYFYFTYTVMLSFCLGTAADHISKVRPAGKAANLIDIMYLFYLPFCMVFTSSDRLHERVVPLFLRDDQSFVPGHEFKAALGALDGHFDRLPPEIKARGLDAFAPSPPIGPSFVITGLYDRHIRGWRGWSENRRELSHDGKKALSDLVKKFEAAKDGGTEGMPLSEASFTKVNRQIFAKKGKWMRVPAEALDRKGGGQSGPPVSDNKAE